jgi:alpha-beta hydrolase superfamily lysophospholipase
MEFNIRLGNKQVLRGMVVSPGENAKAVVILVHGLGEHIYRYEHWASLFRSGEIGFMGVDLPGHGKSDGRRGCIKSYAVTDDMINILIQSCKKIFPSTPVYLYGHSLGGGIVLDYLIRKKPGIKGAIVTSPWLKLSFEPSPAKLKLAAIMKSIVPGLTQKSGLKVEYISHDKDVVDKYKSDPLVHDLISVGLFNSAADAATHALNNAAELTVKTLLMHGSDDMITSPAASREFADKSKTVFFRTWEGGYHELHNEPFKQEVFDYIINWIEGAKV